jgi:heavy metal translocating P-type ATPase
MTVLIENSCTLCQAPINQLSYRDQEDQLFCCEGCQTVYQILKVKDALDNVHEHPLYQQAVLSGLITQPFTAASIDPELVHENQKIALVIRDMWCPSCAQLIVLLLSKEKGIHHCVVDYATDLAIIEYAPRHISKDRIIRLIKQLGYSPSSLEDPRHQAISRTLLLRFIVAAFFSLNVMMFAYPLYAAYFEGDPEGYNSLFIWLSLIGSIPVLTYSASPIWRRCWNGLKTGLWGMELLVCLGVTAATGLSLYEMSQGSSFVYFDSMTVIIVFVLLGKIMESRAKFSAKDALVQLSWALPRRGRKKDGKGIEAFVSIKEFVRGDLLVTKMGEKIVLDGQVMAGEGRCDESLMTGEARPIVKTKGSLVLAGSFLQQGHLTIRVTSSAEESALQKIVQMIEQNIEHKSPDKRIIDSIIRWFIPLVICLAFTIIGLCWIFSIADPGKTVMQTAITRAVAVLLISCPCAIGIAVPLAEAQILNALAKIGIIVRNRSALQFVGRETQFVFDKTGTVTEGKFIVRTGLSDLTNEEQIDLKSLVHYSNHPIAWAIAQMLDCAHLTLDTWEEKVGKGMRGQNGSTTLILGSAAFLAEEGIFCPADQSKDFSEIKTKVYFAKNGCYLTTLTLGDQLRPGIHSFIQALKPVNCSLVSGDASGATQRVAQLCQFDQWIAGYSPLQKREFINQLKQKGEIVAMLGDGINDAPALTASHLGIATISATEMSIQVSDILLTTPHFQALLHLRTIVLEGRKIINQNLFWAFFYNCVGIGLAMAGWLSPLFAACAMVLSSLIVLFNSQRITVK